MTHCKHEPMIPKGNEPDWRMMTWDLDPGLTVHMCKKCHLLYWEKVVK